jgi:hypothetical protein
MVFWVLKTGVRNVLARRFYFGVWVPILPEGYHLVALTIEEKSPFTECPFLSSFYYNRYIPMIALCSENYKVVAQIPKAAGDRMSCWPLNGEWETAGMAVQWPPGQRPRAREAAGGRGSRVSTAQRGRLPEEAE